MTTFVLGLFYNGFAIANRYICKGEPVQAQVWMRQLQGIWGKNWNRCVVQARERRMPWRRSILTQR